MFFTGRIFVVAAICAKLRRRLVVTETRVVTETHGAIKGTRASIRYIYGSFYQVPLITDIKYSRRPQPRSVFFTRNL